MLQLFDLLHDDILIEGFRLQLLEAVTAPVLTKTSRRAPVAISRTISQVLVAALYHAYAQKYYVFIEKSLTFLLIAETEGSFFSHTIPRHTSTCIFKFKLSILSENFLKV